MKNKKFRYSLNSKAFIIGSVIVVLLLNAILISLDSKIPLEFDFTGDHIFALTDESKEIVDKVKEPTEILFLTDGQDNQLFSVITNVLDKYSQRNSKISVRQVDVYKNPAEVQPYLGEIKSIGTLIIKQGERYEIVSPDNFFSQNGYSYIERIVTTKLAGLIDGMSIATMYFTSGHGERPPVSPVLTNAGYKIEALDTLMQEFPTDDKSIIFIAAPQTDFSVEEIDKLDKYLEQGGNVQIYFDPIYGEGDFPNLCAYLSEDWGIIYNNLAVLDKASVIDGTLFMVGELGEHDVVNPVKESQKRAGYGPSNSFTVSPDKPSGVEVHTLLSSYDSAVKTENGNEIVESGSYDVLMAATRETGTVNNEIITGQLIVGGSAMIFDELAADTRFANEDILLNSINWMNGGDASITVRAKSLTSGYLSMTISQVVTWLVILVLVVPAVILVCAIVVFIKRRHK